MGGDCWEEKKIGHERGSNGWNKVISDENSENLVYTYKTDKEKIKYSKSKSNEKYVWKCNSETHHCMLTLIKKKEKNKRLLEK